MSLVFNMVGGGSGGGLTDGSALLSVTVPTGSTVTATKSVVTLQPSLWLSGADSSTEVALFTFIPAQFDSVNPWTITATLGSDTASDTVLITTNQQYEVEISYHVPAEYQEVEYIQSSGTQWINPGVNAPAIHKLIVDFAITAKTSYPMVYAAYYGGNNVFQLADSAGNYNMVFASGSASAQLGSYTLGTSYRAEIDIDSGVAKMGDVSATFSAGTTPPSVIPYFFARHITSGSGAEHLSSVRFYYSKIIGSNDTIMRELYPCYRKSDNVVGLYDNANKTFYTNNGTGSFVAGPDVN